MFFNRKYRLKAEHKQHLMNAIAQAEKQTTGELRVHLSHSKKDDDVQAAAQKQFETLAMHETRERNGILLYVNPDLRRFAIYGDTGIHAKVGDDFWTTLVREVETHIREKNLVHGLSFAIQKMGDALKAHFPHQEKQTDELSNEISESD